MSGWTIITVRGEESENYHKTEYDEKDPWDATADIVATMEDDDRVRDWTTWSDHIYAYLNCQRYDFAFAEELLSDYADMVRDAVVLGANDTTDSGKAKYYPDPRYGSMGSYEEEESGYVGEMALAKISANHGIIARDPFHNNCGRLDDRYLESGSNSGGEME